MISAAPGDVLAVRDRGLGWFGALVRFFERLQGKPNIADHVVILTHQDQVGRWIGIQGKPSGVGMVDITPYLTDSRTRSNHDQPKPNDQGQLLSFLGSAAKSLGISYDWIAIAENLFSTLHLHDLSEEIDHLWRWSPEGLPGHVVCSSLAARLYQLVGWKYPLGEARIIEPADWFSWNDLESWGQHG